MTAELKQNKELLNVYETKTKSLMDDLNRTNGELQQNKREMIGFSEVNKEREEKVQQLKVDLNAAKIRIDELELKLGTLQINYDKMEEQLNTTREDHEDAVDKLHKMNKARHDLEIKLQDEIERNKNLAEVVSLRDETLEKRAQEIEELDKKVIDLERNCETIEIKK